MVMWFFVTLITPTFRAFLRRGQWTSTIDLWVFLVEILSIRFLVHSMLEVPNFAEHLHRVSTNPLRHKEVSYPMKISNWCMKTLAYRHTFLLGRSWGSNFQGWLTAKGGKDACRKPRKGSYWKGICWWWDWWPSPEGNPGWWTMVQFPFFKSTTTWSMLIPCWQNRGVKTGLVPLHVPLSGAYFGIFSTSCVTLKRNMFQSNILI